MSPLPARKRRRLSPPDTQVDGQPQSSDSDAFPDANDEFSKSASKWNLEQDYERRPRKQKEKKESLRLPIKTAEGRLERPVDPRLAELDDGDSSAESSEEEDGDTSATELEEGNVSEPSNLSQRQQVLQAKEELAKLGGLIIEDPEENIGLLRTLAHITSSKNPAVTKLGLATQLAVYKDIIPGYRIRPASEDEMKTKLSKEVKKLRNFEQAIVIGYQKFVKELARVSGLRKEHCSEEITRLAAVAMSCASSLLNHVPHFNFRSELLKLLIDKLGSRQIHRDFIVSCDALENLFQNDDEGNASLEAVAMLAKLIKARDYRVHERVLNVLLKLRLLTEFSKKGSTTRIDKEEEDEPLPRTNVSKDRREFRTKKQRKIAKERKGIEKEMKEADAVVGHEQRDQLQAETLKLVFGVYFRVLKARTPNLMGPVLEGLVKYAHLINQEFFGDLLESLKELIQDTETQLNEDGELNDGFTDDQDANEVLRNVTRESLLCVVTAFALLQGQDAAYATSSLKLDLNFFISHLYRTLFPVALYADVELSSKSDPTPDNSSSNPSTPQNPRSKVDVQRTIVILLRSLQAVLLPSNTRTVPPIRLAAFVKQILTSSLHMPEKSCTAMLGLTIQTMKAHKRKIAALWQTEERRGDGVYDALKWDVEGSNPFAATVWEGELLRLHYAPSVREGVRTLESAVLET